MMKMLNKTQVANSQLGWGVQARPGILKACFGFFFFQKNCLIQVPVTKRKIDFQMC